MYIIYIYLKYKYFNTFFSISIYFVGIVRVIHP